jgi:hypothetical protein
VSTKLDKTAKPGLRSRPLHRDQRRFTADQQLRYRSREEWKAHLIEEYPAQLAKWEEDRRLYELEEEPQEEEPPEEPAQQDNMEANADQILRCLKLMMSMKYDGTSDITLFLRGFDGLRTRILGLDPDYDDFVIEAILSTCLEDAKPSPRVGVDGERYIGPATWWAKQPIDDVDTYDKLKRKLEAKFKAKVESMSKIFSRLAQLERGDQTVRDFAYEFDDTRGTTEIPDFNLIDIFTKQMPWEVIKRLLISCPDFREKTYEEVKNLCVKLDHAVRNPDPLEKGYAKKFSKLRLGEYRQHHVARLERQLAESQEQLNHLLRLQGAERWTLRAAPVRILTRKTDPREFQKYFGEAENLEPEGSPRRVTGEEEGSESVLLGS